ncbi:MULTISPECIES: sensor histidine kinase [Actinomadura]|uniref:histidine kinase n=1 Tax=Actinomadura madurae TaxID=1993 RepID=A0A1I5RN42_9ACTN|nr:HAMP domain-containing sensor histidine kinase [Actinomadura madurae]SFP59974.1 Signal transduction histidine kinase [Actinomadura madurae]SPT59192.1 Signal transduction histidine-protein kinase BaeS [Actinomadura madurae]
MPRLVDSVRARTTVGATAVVAVALAVAGLTVMSLLRANLARHADLQAEMSAREIAAKLATGTPVHRLDLDDTEERPIQIVDASGRVRAASEQLEAVSGTGGSGTGGSAAAARPGAGALPGEGDDDLDEEDPRPGHVSDDVRHATGRATMGGRADDYRFAAVEATTPAGETVTVYAGAALTATRDAVAAVGRAMLAGLPLLLAVVAAVTWLVTRRALRPVAAIRGELAEITASGDLTRRVPVPGTRDEVAELAGTTNETLAALERSVTRQRGFVADAAHELRTPIASLRTQLEVGAAHPRLLDVAELAADVVRLQHLAADLLLLARLDAGADPAPAVAVDMAELVREELRRRPAGGRALAIEAEVAGAPRALGSRTRLARVLSNLLDNAERHAAGRIRVGLGAQEGATVLRVADDGAGVPPDDRERIFERFVRLDEARSRDDGGSGLGLAITRDLVLAHGGMITVGDAPEGGALFEVRLPPAGTRPAAGGREARGAARPREIST